MRLGRATMYISYVVARRRLRRGVRYGGDTVRGGLGWKGEAGIRYLLVLVHVHVCKVR